MKKARGKTKRRKGAPKKKGSKMTMVNRMPKSLHTVVAPRYLTELEYGFTGTATMGAGVQGYFDVWANGLWFPGITTYAGGAGLNFTTTAGADLGVGGVVYPATVALTALQPVGETMLASLYDKYRVHGSSMSVVVTPEASSANLMVTLVPLSGNEVIAGIPANDIQRAQSLPRSKAITVSPNNNIKLNRVHAKCAPHNILGMTKQQYNDNPNTSGLVAISNPGGPSGPADAESNVVFWQVNLSPFASGFSTSANIEVRITYLVEFFDPLGPTDT